MSNYLSYFLTPALAVNLLILAMVSLALTLLARGRLATTPRRVLFFLTALSLGVIIHVTLLREPPLGSCLECLNNWSIERLLSGQLSTEVLLNIALFMPLGFLATLLWRKPWRVTAFAAVLSYAIEIVQPLIGIGANDPSDIAANTFGAFAGSGLAVAVLIVKDTIAFRRVPVRLAVSFLVTVALTVAAVLGLSVGVASALQADGAEDLESVFAGTTLSDFQANEEEWSSKLGTIWEQNRMPRDEVHSDDMSMQHRFSWTFWLSTRCVTATWTADGFTTTAGQGGDCRQPLG